MFEDALFATNRRRTPQQRWAAALSFIVQVTLVTVLVAMPMFFTEALPLNIRTITELPAVPRSAGPPPSEPPMTPTPPQGSRSEFVNDQLIFIRVPTEKAKPINDVRPPAQPCVALCVENSTGPGSEDGTALEYILGRGPAVGPPLPKFEPSKPVRVSVMNEGLLIRKVTPAYPYVARMTGQQGTVLLHAIIGRDGTIQHLQAISGPPLLIQAAMDAVKQWRYRPYILNGQPVEVDTQITVNFRLGG